MFNWQEQAPRPGQLAIEAPSIPFERYAHQVRRQLAYWEDARAFAEQYHQERRKAIAHDFVRGLRTSSNYVMRATWGLPTLNPYEIIHARKTALGLTAVSQLLHMSRLVETIGTPDADIDCTLDFDYKGEAFRLHVMPQDMDTRLGIEAPLQRDTWHYGAGLYVNRLEPAKSTVALRNQHVNEPNFNMGILATYEPFIEKVRA